MSAAACVMPAVRVASGSSRQALWASFRNIRMFLYRAVAPFCSHWAREGRPGGCGRAGCANGPPNRTDGLAAITVLTSLFPVFQKQTLAVVTERATGTRFVGRFRFATPVEDVAPSNTYCSGYLYLAWQMLFGECLPGV